MSISTPVGREDAAARRAGEETALQAKRGPRGVVKALLVVAKVAVTGGCLYLAFRSVDRGAVAALLERANGTWFLLAVVLLAAQVPLVGIRLGLVVRSLGHGRYAIPARTLQLANAGGLFVAQVFPLIVGDGIRAWYLRTVGVALRHAVWGVLLDRAVGVYTLFLAGLAIFLVSASARILGDHRPALLLLIAATVVVGTIALVSASAIGRLFGHSGRFRAVGLALMETHRALLGSRPALSIFALAFLVHGLTFLSAWCTGLALGLPITLFDAAVLVVCMLAVSMIPISVGGWGVREVTVVALLSGGSIPAEGAVLFSIAFGVSVVLSTIPGAIAWALSGRIEEASEKRRS